MAIIELSGPIEQLVDEPISNIIELTPPGSQEGAPDAQAVEPQQGFLERFGGDIETRRAQTTEIFERMGEQTPEETLLQLVGKTFAGTTLDFIGEGLVSAFRALPDVIENPIRDQAAALMQSEIGQLGLERLGQGANKFEEFAKENPRAARNIESLVNVGLLFAPAKTSKAATETEATILSRAAQSIEEAAETQIAARQTALAQNLVTPKQTAAIRTEQVARESEEGILRAAVTEPSASETRMIQEVARLPGLSSSNTLRGNFKVIQEANRSEAITLKEALKANEVIFPRKEFTARINKVLDDLAENPLLVGDARTSAEKIVKKMRQIILQNKSTGSGLLKARKELDTWIRSQKGPNVFDPAKESAISIAIRDIRTATNNFLAEKATNVGVKESLSKQSALFGALDNIAPKAADEGRSIVTRAMQNIAEVIPMPSGIRQSIAATGLIAIPAIVSPSTTAAILATALAGKAAVSTIRSPRTKKALSSLLKQVDKALNAAKLTPELALKLRADRAALVELIDTIGNDDET